MNIFYIIAFLVGTGFGWCLCSLVGILRRYLEMKRQQKKSERTWAELRPYLEHCLGHNDEGGLAWLSYEELKERERRKKQNEQKLQQQVRGNSEETSSAS